MKNAETFHRQLVALAGENPWAEPMLCFSSIVIGILMCRLVYRLMKASSPYLYESYNNLSKTEKVEWDNRGFSTLHAIILSMTALYLLFLSNFFQDSTPYDPVVFRSSIFSQVMLGVSTGYFISDLAMILWFFPALGGKEYVVHHLLSLMSIALALYSGHGHIYIYLVLFTEITTPFLNLRWYLSMSGLKNSKAYLINGIVIFFIWLVARVLLFIYFFLHIYWHFDEVSQVFAAGFYFLFIAPPSLALMNLYWFYKITRGLIRALSKPKSA